MPNAKKTLCLRRNQACDCNYKMPKSQEAYTEAVLAQLYRGELVDREQVLQSLQAENPALYETACRILRDRASFRGCLASCASQDEVQKWALFSDTSCPAGSCCPYNKGGMLAAALQDEFERFIKGEDYRSMPPSATETVRLFD